MCKVLIVDDYPMVRQALELLLKSMAGIHVIGQACNGLEAVEMCELLQPDLILMDLMMPVMGGIDAAKLIHQHYPHIKIIFLTIMSNEENLIMGLNDKTETYLIKNSQIHEIPATIRKACGNL